MAMLILGGLVLDPPGLWKIKSVLSLAPDHVPGELVCGQKSEFMGAE